jgi:phytoene dehydrogenase-like protein
MALSGLPRFSCLPEDAPSPYGSTIHLLPGSAGLAGLGSSDLGDADSPMAALRAMWADVQAGRLPAEPTIEWYLHTTVDETLRDEARNHSSALFVQSVPYALDGTTWDEALPGYIERLLEICDRYAPGTSDLVVDTMPLTPPGIEEHFGITGGHIHHVDNTVAFDERMPYATGLPGLYAGSAGAHPAGSVIGAAGHNAARRILADLGR